MTSKQKYKQLWVSTLTADAANLRGAAYKKVNDKAGDLLWKTTSGHIVKFQPTIDGIAYYVKNSDGDLETDGHIGVDWGPSRDNNLSIYRDELVYQFDVVQDWNG